MSIPAEHAVTCTTCSTELDMRDLAQCFCHGLPVPDAPGEFFCLTPEEIEVQRNGIFKDTSPGISMSLALQILN